MDNPYNNIYKSIITSFSDFIKIELNKEFYLAGDEIKGNIIFDNINNIKVNDITIFLYQKESWFVQETSEVKYGEKNNQLLCKYIIDLKEYLNNNEILVPGKYIFPFQLKLSDDLEPSFEYPYPNRYSYLRYSLICESNPNLPEIKHQKFILIKSLSYNILPKNSFSSIKNVHKWGFLDGGTTILKVSYEKGNYQINNLVPLNVDIDNSRGKLKVKECKIRVIRTIEFSKSKGPEKYPLEKTINSHVFSAEVFPYNKKNFLFQIQLIDNDLVDFKYIKEEIDKVKEFVKKGRDIENKRYKQSNILTKRRMNDKSSIYKPQFKTINKAENKSKSDKKSNIKVKNYLIEAKKNTNKKIIWDRYLNEDIEDNKVTNIKNIKGQIEGLDNNVQMKKEIIKINGGFLNNQKLGNDLSNMLINSINGKISLIKAMNY
jgi:hypothetical protein